MKQSPERRTDMMRESLSTTESEFLHFLLGFRELKHLWKHELVAEELSAPTSGEGNSGGLGECRKQARPPISWSWRAISWSLVCSHMSDSHRYLDLSAIADFGEAGHIREIPQCWSWRPASWRQVLRRSQASIFSAGVDGRPEDGGPDATRC